MYLAGFFLNLILMFIFICLQSIYLYRLSMICFSLAIVFHFGLIILNVADIHAIAVVFLRASRTLCFLPKCFPCKRISPRTVL